MEDFNSLILDNFLSNSEISMLIDFAQNNQIWENAGHAYWENRVSNSLNIYLNINKKLGIELYKIRDRVKEKIESHFKLNKPIYPDSFQIVRWPSGLSQDPHTDDMKIFKGGEAHHHRSFGSVIYLNNDFEGGKTYYPNYNIEITPKPGTLLVHPAHSDYLHGVSEVKGNTRYTVASFWTYELSSFDNWILSEGEINNIH